VSERDRDIHTFSNIMDESYFNTSAQHRRKQGSKRRVEIERRESELM